MEQATDCLSLCGRVCGVATGQHFVQAFLESSRVNMHLRHTLGSNGCQASYSTNNSSYIT
eukprot:2013807-Amphidinium_carterae.1